MGARLRAVLIPAGDATPDRLRGLAASGRNAVAIDLAESGAEAALDRVVGAGLDPYGWIEVGRSPELADANPRWMASLQGHGEWMRLFPHASPPGDGEVMKAWPWVPILYEEAFGAHLARIRRLLDGVRRPKGLFLNDLQGAPSACGCGNILCRWTADYGPIRTATPSPPGAAARFVRAVREIAGDVPVIPIWTTECEAHDTASDGACAGVPCFEGRCWRESAAQLAALDAEAATLGVLTLYKELGRDLDAYGAKAGWIAEAVRLLREVPPRHGTKAIPAARLICVLEGWDATAGELAAREAMADAAGVSGTLVALCRIEQSWEPRRIPVR